MLEILLTGRAIPIMITCDIIFGIIGGGTVGTIPITVGTTFGERMRRRVIRTIPGVIAMRLVGSSMVRLLVGTVPMMYATDRRRIGGRAFGAVPIAVIAGFFHPMMGYAAGTPPVVFTVGFFRQRGIAADAEAAVMVAISVNVIRLFAGRAVPIMIAMDGWHIRLLAGRAEPIIFRASGIHGVMRFADLACPVVFAVLCFCQNRIAFRTIKTSVWANVIQRMPLFAVGAIPEMFARLADINRRLAGRAVPAVRIRSGTDHVRRMVKFTGRTIPVMRTVFSDR